jgi:putative flippase GtrA
MTNRPPESPPAPQTAPTPWRRLEALAVALLGIVGFSPELARQLIRFIAVGLVAAAVYVAVMAVMVEGLRAGVLVAAFFAFVIATVVSFFGNALWSFGKQPTPGKALWFFAINTTGLGLNMLIAWALERAGAHWLLISLTVLVVVPLFNFAGHRIYTFSGGR